MNTVNKLFRIKAPQVFKSGQPSVRCANPSLICGVELEVENASGDVSDYDGHISSAWRIDRDGSLRGGHTAYEFISQPLPMEKLIPELDTFFKFTKFGPRNYSDRCSIHVHTNVTDYTQDMLASLAMVYSVVEDVLFRYVNFHKAEAEEGYCRDTNIYCIPWNQCRMNHRLVEKVFNPQKNFHRWQKYTALNLLPITTQGTVEWRHMHGTADMEKLTTWLNLIGSIMDYARKTPLDQVVNTIRSLNDTSAYRQFFLDVLQGHLEYDDQYAPVLSEGVVNAKYSLQDWDRSKAVVEDVPETDSNSFEAVTALLRERQAFFTARMTNEAAQIAERDAHRFTGAEQATRVRRDDPTQDRPRQATPWPTTADPATTIRRR